MTAIMATSSLYGCLLMLVIGQQAHQVQATATTGDSCGALFVSKPGQGIINPPNNLPAMARSLDVFSVSSAKECRTKCCSEPNCNLAMIQDKDGAKTCYLANCLYNGISVCELHPTPGMDSYQQEVGRKPTLSAIQSTDNPLDGYPLKESHAVESNQEFKYEEYCTPKAETGLCRAAFPRWSFDTETNTCKKFIFGGCGGNKNNYETEKDCMDKCLVAKPDPQKLQGGRGNGFQEYCAVPKVTGPCRAAFPRWYYDLTSGSCIMFTYGGCKGNKNNYISKDKCEQQCANQTDEHENYDPLRPFHHSTTAVALAVLLAIMIAILLGAMVVVFVKMARRHQRDSGLAAVWSPIDDKECLMNNAYTL